MAGIRGEVTGRRLRQTADHREPDRNAPRNAPRGRWLPVPRGAYSIKQFCVAHAISEAMYFKMKRLGLGPKEMMVGARVLISVESARDWRRACEEREKP
jgi:hypothetical protein